MTVVAGPFFAAAGLLGVAGALKLLRPASTAQALRAAGLAGAASGGGRLGSATIGRLVGGAELALAAGALVVGGRVAAGLLAVTYLGFALFTARLLRTAEAGASCGCFGAVTSRPPGCTWWSTPAWPWSACPPWCGRSRRSGSVLADQPLAGVPFVALTALCGWLLYALLTVLPDVRAAMAPPERARSDQRPDRRDRDGGHRSAGGAGGGLLRSHAEILRRLHQLGSGLDEEGSAANGTREGRVRSGGQEFRVMPQMPSPPSREGFTGGHDLAGAGLVDDAVTVRVDRRRAPHAPRVPLERLPHLPAVLGCVRPPGRTPPSA